MFMTFNEWIKGKVGRSARIAEHFGLTPSAVSQWQSNGVPRERIKEVRDLTGGDVSLEELLSAPATSE